MTTAADLSVSIIRALLDYYREDITESTAARWAGDLLQDWPRLTPDELTAAIRAASLDPAQRTRGRELSVRHLHIWLRMARKAARVAREGYSERDREYDELAVHSRLRAASSPGERWDICCAAEHIGSRPAELVAWCVAESLPLARPIYQPGCRARWDAGECPVREGAERPDCPACERMSVQEVAQV